VHIVRRSVPGALRLLFLWATASVALLGCEARVSLGGECFYHSECNGLLCRYGRCRAQCVTDVDCGGGGLVCNAGVCARPDEGCTTADDCRDPELACAGTICARRCDEVACNGDAYCEDTRFAVPVCVPRVALDAGSAADAGLADVGVDGATPLDAAREDAFVAPGAIRDLCVGLYYACVARADGTVGCWGTGTSGELGGGAALVAGAGVVDCAPNGVGGNLCSTDLVTVVGGAGRPLEGVVRLACGERTTLALTEGGALHSWGLASNGLLGRAYGGASPSAAAAPVTDQGGRPLSGVVEATMGLHHGCALRVDGSTWCWGAWDARHQYGQLGTGASDPPAVDGAVEATVLHGAVRVAAANENTCAVDAGGQLVCVGSNEHAAAGSATAPGVAIRTPNPVAGAPSGVRALAAGPAYVCALAGGGVYCWGQAGEGSLGRDDVGTYEARCPDGGSNYLCDPGAAVVSSALSFDAIATGPQSSTVCGLSGGLVYCWGQSDHGSAGATGRLLVPERPIAIEGGTDLRDVRLLRVGGRTACAFTTGGLLYCWGANDAAHFRTAPDDSSHTAAVPVRLD
jgi:hypothetical protein